MSGFRSFWVRVSLLASIAVTLAMLSPFAGMSSDWQYNPVTVGGVTTTLGAVLVYGSIAIALLGLLMSLIPPMDGFVPALLAVVIPGALVGYFWFMTPSDVQVQPVSTESTPPAQAE